MRKTEIVHSKANDSRAAEGSWFDLEKIAVAELSSENGEHPFEQALLPGSTRGWRAATPGPQLIRLRFDEPQTIRRIHLQFMEEEMERSQEIALFATSAVLARKELVRQQWQFSPSGTTSEIEDYYFDLNGITVLELEIDPGRHDKHAFASLQLLQIR